MSVAEAKAAGIGGRLRFGIKDDERIVVLKHLKGCDGCPLDDHHWFRINGADVDVYRPCCRDWIGAGRIQKIVWSIENDFGLSIVSEPQAEFLLNNRIRMAGMQIGGLPIKRLLGIEPVCESGRTWKSGYFLLRDLARKVPKVLCGVCRRILNSRTSPREAVAVHIENGFLKYDVTVWICSVDCRLKLLKKHERMEKWLKREKVKLANCRQQLKALRLFLKNGNQEVFRSLPEGFGPARTSPS